MNEPLLNLSGAVSVDDRLREVMEGQEFRTLLVLIEIARKGAFVFAVVDNPDARLAFFREIRRRHPGIPAIDFRLDPDRPDPIEYLGEIPEERRGEKWIVGFHGFESKLEEFGRWLDLRREWLASHPHVLIVWIRPDDRAKLADAGPNFFSRHSGVFDLTTPIREVVRESLRSMPVEFTSIPRADLERRRSGLLSLLDRADRDSSIDAWTRFDLLLQLGKLEGSLFLDQYAFLHLSRALNLEADANPRANLRADLRLRLGRILAFRSEYDRALPLLNESLTLFMEIHDKKGEADARLALGNAALWRSDHAEARAAYERALSLYREVGDKLGEAECVRRLGDIALRRSDHVSARESFERALSLFREVGDKLGEANCVQSLGDIALERSDHASARESYERALPLYREVGSKLGEAECIRSLGDIAVREAEAAIARERFGAALELYGQIHEPYSMGWAHVRLARLAADADEKQDQLRKARELWAGIDRPDLVAWLDREFGPPDRA